MITEDYVSLEIAKLLKEKGFDERCISYYPEGKNTEVCHSFLYERNSEWLDGSISAPTHQMALKWLREACVIEISIACFELDSYRYDINEVNSSYFRRQIIEFHSDEFCSYEDAVEAALKYCLTNLI